MIDQHFHSRMLQQFLIMGWKLEHARLKMVLLAYSLLHLLREFYMEGEEVKRSVEWLIRRVVKGASRISYHSPYWWVHMASSFLLRHHYQAVLGHG